MNTPAKIDAYAGVRHPPRDHQSRVLREAGLKTGHCFWVDPGGGKTYICLTEASYLWMTGKVDAMIIIAPQDVHIQWVEEQAPEHLAIPFVAGHNQQSKTVLKKGLFKRKHTDALPIFAINYDALRTKDGRSKLDAMYRTYPRIYLAIDESQRIKGHTAARTVVATEYARRARFVRALSGTPILKGIEDLFSQYDAVIPGMTGFSNYFAFRQYFCMVEVPPGRNVDPRARIITGYQNESVLEERTAPYVSVIKADEFMDRPDPDFMRVPAPMTTEQKRIFNQMDKELVAEVKGGTITVKNALSKVAKLLQIASGYIYDEEGEWRPLSPNKTDVITELVGQLEEPVIIFSPFIPLGEMIRQRLRTSLSDRKLYDHTTLDEWKDDPVGILVGNQAGRLGTGRNLQHSSATIYASNNFASEPRWQSLKRTDRMGQLNHCRYWDIVAPGSRDASTLRALSGKEEIAETTLAGLREWMTDNQSWLK